MNGVRITSTERQARTVVSSPAITAGEIERETPDIETSSDAYAQRFSGQVGAWFLRIQEQVILNMLNRWPGASILEVGGGHGQVVGALIRQGHAVTV